MTLAVIGHSDHAGLNLVFALAVVIICTRSFEEVIELALAVMGMESDSSSSFDLNYRQQVVVLSELALLKASVE